MKNRRLLTILIIFVIIGSFAVLGSALFAVRTVDIQFTNKPDFFIGEEQQHNLELRLRESVLPITKGRNILFGINRNNVMSALENAETRVRVMNIEAKFPNRLEIKVRERYPVFKFKSGDMTAVMDGGLRILDKLSDEEFDILETKTNWPLISLPDEIADGLVFSDLNVGEFLTALQPESDEIKVLEQLTPFFAQIKTNEDAICNIFESISFDTDTGDLRLVMVSRTENREGNYHQRSFEFIVWDPAKNVANCPKLTDKLLKGWLALEANFTAPGKYQVYEMYEIVLDDGEVLKFEDGIMVTYRSGN